LVSKWLRAFQAGAFNPDSKNFNENFDADQVTISKKECFDLLAAVSCSNIEPSFAAFHTFVMTMEGQFKKVAGYPV
jgi:hypothetical protein